MYLTNDEERMFQGEYGPVKEWAMKFMVEYGDALGAERLIPIESAYIAWSFTLEDRLPRNVFRQMAKTEMAVPTYTNCLPDLENASEYGLTDQQVEKQRNLEEAARNIGVMLIGTCVPYEAGWIPVAKTHVASGESSVINFVNSYFNARTLREGYPSKWAAALTGKAPFADLHTDEGRRGDLLVKLNLGSCETSDYDALGYHVGDMPFDVPVFAGMPKRVKIGQLKQMGAALATSGSVGMYHIVGITAESPTVKAAFQGDNPQETVEIGNEELNEAYRRLSTHGDERVNHVLLGCPHYTLEQLMSAAALLRGKRLHRETKLWILVPPSVRCIAERMGLANDVRTAGGSLLTGCWNKGSLTGGMDLRSGMTLVTDSAKCAHYSRSAYPGIDVWFGTRSRCIEAAITGKWT